MQSATHNRHGGSTAPTQRAMLTAAAAPGEVFAVGPAPPAQQLTPFYTSSPVDPHESATPSGPSATSLGVRLLPTYYARTPLQPPQQPSTLQPQPATSPGLLPA